MTSAVHFRRPAAGGRRHVGGRRALRPAFVGILALAIPAVIVLTPGIAAAQDNQGTGTAFAVDLNGSVNGTVVVNANAIVAASSAPPDGTANVSSVAAQLGPTTAVTADGAASSNGTSSAAQNQGTSTLTGLNASVLDQVITATAATGAATCPAQGAPVAATALTNLNVFGTPIAGTANLATTVVVPVTVPGLVEASLTAEVTSRAEQTTATTATAIAALITLTLNGVQGATPVSVPLGNFVYGQATCFTPPPPTATAIDPAVGPVTGGQTVTITGTEFSAGQTSVTIGGILVPAAAVTVTSPTTLTFVTPAHAVGAVTATVTTPAGTSGPLGYRYQPAPTAVAIDPAVGPVGGGQTITILGSNFVAGQTSVTIGGVTVPASAVTVISATSLRFASPAHAAGAFTVRVTTLGGPSGPLGYRYLDPPTIIALDPAQGPATGGQTVTVLGSGFVAGLTTVTIDGATIPAADVTVVSPTFLRFRTLAHFAGLVDVTVATPDGRSARFGFRFLAAPVAAGLDPADGPTGGGQRVRLFGIGFVQGETTVTIGGITIPADQVDVLSSTTLTFVTPAHRPGTVNVTVTTLGGTSDPLSYRYGGQALPFTGADTAGPARLGLRLLLAGVAALLLGRRRRRWAPRRHPAAG